MTTTISDEQVRAAEDARYDYLCNYSLSQYTVVGPEAKDAMRAALEAYEALRAPDPRAVELKRCADGLLIALDLKHPAVVRNNYRRSLRKALAAMENDTTQCHWCGSDPRATCHVCKRG